MPRDVLRLQNGRDEDVVRNDLADRKFAVTLACSCIADICAQLDELHRDSSGRKMDMTGEMNFYCRSRYMSCAARALSPHGVSIRISF